MFSGYFIYFLAVTLAFQVQGDKVPKEADGAPEGFEIEYTYLDELSQNPQNSSASRELGLYYVTREQPILARKYLKQSMTADKWSNVTAIMNYALQLYYSEKHTAAILTLELALQLFHPRSQNLFFTLGFIHLKMGNLTACHSSFRRVLVLEPKHPDFYINIIACFNSDRLYLEAKEYIAEALQYFPDHARLLFVCGVNFHYQSRFDLALELYQLSGKVDPSSSAVYVNIASVYQALGLLKEARSFYEHVYDSLQNDSDYLNNLGSLLLVMNEFDEGERLLKKSIDANPEQEHAAVNLAGYYQDEGLLTETEQLLRRAIKISENFLQYELRVSCLLSPVAVSWTRALQERRRMLSSVTALNSRPPPEERHVRPLMSGLDRVHFYVQYHGLNDRRIQEAVAQSYRRIIRNFSQVAPHLPRTSAGNAVGGKSSVDKGRHIIRIAFMSKLFGVFEPHGLLLDGVVKYLPRSRFRVLVLEVAPGGAQKLVSPSIQDNADEVIQISLDHVHATQTVFDLKLDILVFADVISEPINHFLLHSRFAPVQIAFWGNPLTSGSQHIDYFISADFMEHPFRTRMPVAHEPYTEQVVLLPGQGIWYFHPESIEMKKCDESVAHITQKKIGGYLREELGLRDDWFIFLCPQSLFKLHPLFDQVAAAILRASPESHVIFTTGRRPRWTEIFIQRMLRVVHPESVNRLHFIERVSSEQFIDLIKIADVLLHPFPFDGSRTSADAIAANIPYVTLPSEYLKGRMGASFLRTMNIPELVAKNVNDYVDICVRLSVDGEFFRNVKNIFQERSWLIWQDMEVPYAWTQFLSLAVGRPYKSSFEEYLESSCVDCNVTQEVYYHRLREENHELFDKRIGSSEWLLDNRGVAILEDDVVGSNPIPRIFNNWK